MIGVKMKQTKSHFQYDAIVIIYLVDNSFME